MNNKTTNNDLKKRLISELNKVADTHQKTHFQLLNKGMTAEFGSSEILEKSILFPSEIRGFRKAIKTVEEFIDSEVQQ